MANLRCCNMHLRHDCPNSAMASTYMKRCRTLSPEFAERTTSSGIW